ncbi:MAG: DUF1638 domain-containing protein, partial [Nitrospirae bacterium]|nr:DUF1638 domain-containing protein [Nitrospirota bacterium]
MAGHLVIACEVFEKELRGLCKGADHRLMLLQFGYHKSPNALQKRLQGIIDGADGFDAVLLLYGYCGGTLRIKANKTPIVFPRCHDCFDIMLGSEKRLSLVEEEIGSYFLSEGWINKDGTPIDKIAAAMKRMSDKGDLNIEWTQEELIREFYPGYKRLIFVKTGFETTESITKAELAANKLGWEFHEKDADLSIMQRLLN